MDRRTFIGIVTSGLAIASSKANAQATRPRRIGLLHNGSSASSSQAEAFRRGLRELGWIEGKNISIEHRLAEGEPDRLPALVAELIRERVEVIVLSGSPAVRAAQQATDKIPIVFVILVDPVLVGFVPSLARPGGNLTGLASQFEELITRQLQLLKEAVPNLTGVALLHRPEVVGVTLTAAERAAQSLGFSTKPLVVANVSEFENAYKTARSDLAGAIQVFPSPYFDVQRKRLIELAARYRLPAIYEFKNYVEDGNEMYRGMARYVDRILRGANPGDLPIERPARFEFVVNLKTAAALGLTVSQPLLQQADELIR